MKTPSLILLFGLAFNAMGATVYVSKSGVDSNPGTVDLPFLTVQHGVNTAQAGDTVLVGAGTYTENVTTARSGSSGSPIVVDGQGVATLWSFLTTHQYIYFNNWTVAGKASGWWFWMGKGGHHNIVSNSVFDGAYNQSLDALMRWDNPSGAELPFGTNCASDCLVISNTFERAINEKSGVVMFGDRNSFYGNVCKDYDLADFLYLWGRSNNIACNLFTNLFILHGTAGHPDLVQSFGQSGAGADGITIERNKFIDCPGDAQICMFEGQDCPFFTNWTFRNNLFVRIGSKGTMAMPNVNWYNNTFVECATNTAAAPYVLIFTTETNGVDIVNFAASTGHGCHVLNNAFVNCGDGDTNKQLYYFWTYCTNVSADYNFGCNTNYHASPVDPSHRSVGASGGWDPYGWWEAHGINGGDPKLVSAGLGNFRLQSSSSLIGAGTNLSSLFTTDLSGNARPGSGGWSMGAYEGSGSLSVPVVTLPCGDYYNETAVNSKAIRAFADTTSGSIGLVWPANQYQQSVTISRRVYTNHPAYWQSWTALWTNSDPVTVTQAYEFVDSTAQSGIHYEYGILSVTTNVICGSNTNQPQLTYQYIDAGINVPLRDTNGNVELLVATNIAGALSGDISTLTNDLVASGYRVFQHNIAPLDMGAAGWFQAVTNVKALIRADYNTASNADWTLFIVGHVPIPYSGDSSPGSHTPNLGAHPADWYYADMGSATNWGDTVISDVSATETNCWNSPGDGKFDPSFLPAAPTMRLGRIDLVNMPTFGKTEAQLIQQYLQRDHAWRTKQFTVRSMAIINTNGTPYEANSLFSQAFGIGTNSVVLGMWFSGATNAATNFLYAASRDSGEHDGDVLLGFTTNQSAKSFYAAFTEIYGSYYGDWDSAFYPNDFSQCVLSMPGYALTTLYNENTLNSSPSTLGEPIGQDSFALACNKFQPFENDYISSGHVYLGTAYQTVEAVSAYVSLLGDPTLKTKVVNPPSLAMLTTSGADTVVTWTNSTDSNIQGYHVYRAPLGSRNSFARLTTNTVAGPYTNTGAASGSYDYMVRAVKLESSDQGSFYNASAGVFASVGITNSMPPPSGSGTVSRRAAILIRLMQ